MPDRSAHWAELLTPQLTDAFYIGFSDDGRRASMIPTLFGTKPSQRAFEEHLGVGTLSSSGWNFEKTGRVEYDQHNKCYLKRFTHAEFAKGIVVQRKLIDDNLTDIVFDETSGLGDSAYRKREKGGASIFNNAFVGSGENEDGLAIVGPDGVALCSTAHPRSADESGTTQSNKAELSLTAANVGLVRIKHQGIKDDRGDIMDVMPDQLIVPPELEDEALRISRSTLDPASANNAVNPQSGRFSMVCWHYLTSAKNWFLADSSRRARSLLWYDRIPLEFGKEGDFETYQAKFAAYMRYSYGWRDWAWIYGAEGP
jgi:Mu-like prophage major head subunit gpT